MFLIAGSVQGAAAENPAGRWEGNIQIPGEDLNIVLDLLQDGSGKWSGAITIPSLNIKGAALSDIVIKQSDLNLAIKSALGSPDTGPAKLSAHLAGDAMSGNFLQAGNSAPFNLRRTGDAQVDAVAQSTAVTPELEGEWKGEYEIFGYKRHVSLKLFNHQGASATADFVVVGKRVNNLPVDLVTQESDFLTVDSHETGLSYEGRFLRTTKELAGVITQGGIETPLVLRRSN
jgi:hypothetical protein